MFSDKDYSLYDGIPKQWDHLKNKIFDEWEIPPWKIMIHKNKLLGEGKFGKVYLATWNATTVVAKIINDDLPEDKQALFKCEFNVLTKTHHPNIVQLLGYVYDPFIIVMEYLSNGELLEYTKQNTMLSKEKKINICLDILRGLIYLHNRKPHYVVHRDIKPQNILISPSGVAKIGDFGLSRLFSLNIKRVLSKNNLKSIDDDDDDDDDLTHFVGSKRYMAPEIRDGRNYDYKVDIWSAGVIFAELFENERYNEGITWHYTPKSIQKIIRKYMLLEDPDKRLTATAIIEELFKIKANKCLCFY